MCLLIKTFYAFYKVFIRHATNYHTATVSHLHYDIIRLTSTVVTCVQYIVYRIVSNKYIDKNEYYILMIHVRLYECHAIHINIFPIKQTYTVYYKI